MRIHEFGKNNKENIVLIHPAGVMWDYFSYVWPLLEKDYHVIVPALPGYDKETPGEDFTSIEEIAEWIANWLLENNCSNIACLYGCSMGGAVVTRILADNRLAIQNAVVDGGITPYQLPWLITRLIAIRDFLMVSTGKFGGMKLLEKAFSTDEYTKEDLQYVADVLKWISYRTIWRTFESCNNYTMPKHIKTGCQNIYYWYGASEEKDRKWDIRYYQKHSPYTQFEKIEHVGHGGMSSLHPDEFAQRMDSLIRNI